MDPDRLEALFSEALSLDEPRERSAFVECETRDSPEMRRELQALLAAHDDAGDFLETPATAEAAALVPALLGSNLIGSSIDSWRIDSLIHSGGMGSVFRATRIEEDFTQSGALKLVKVGFETPELVERFSQERQLLARVEHPNIARLLDGGTTAEGLPWLSMEFIDGLAIDAYADHHRLGLKGRLELFDQLADAIAYLHQSLITHRDIKASNVLVDNNGHVRVLDFGIASLLNDAAAVAEATTDRRLSLSTAAPEQLRGGAISTSTDVYALGVLLYRLLCGEPPYRIDANQSAAEIEHLICDKEPPRASVALERSADAEELALARGLSLRRLITELRGDLDIVLAKALEKEPGRRYRSVAELRVDLENCRQNRPVLAQPSSAMYRSRKFLRRHWRGLGATAAFVLALATGLGLALWQAEEARRQRDRAQAMNGFMQEVLAQADPYTATEDKTVRDVLAEASELLDQRFFGQPLLEASIRQAVGGVQLTLLELDAGEANLLRARELLQTDTVRDDELLLRTEAHLAWVDFERENLAASVAAYESVIARFSTDQSAEFRAMVRNDFGLVLGESGRYAESIEQQKIAMRLDPESIDRIATLINMGFAYDGLGELEKAKQSYQEAIDRLRDMGEAGINADLAHVLNNYGNVLSQHGKDENALPYYLESLDVRYRVYGGETDSVAVQHLNVGRLLLDMQRPEEAREHLATASRIFPRYREADSIYVRIARASHARAVLLAHADNEAQQAALATLAEVSAALRADAGSRESRFVEQVTQWWEEGRAQQGSR